MYYKSNFNKDVRVKQFAHPGLNPDQSVLVDPSPGSSVVCPQTVISVICKPFQGAIVEVNETLGTIWRPMFWATGQYVVHDV